MSNADACHWMLRFKVLEGDVTRQKVDAVASAGKSSPGSPPRPEVR